MAGLEWPADLGHGTFTGRFGFMDADGHDPDRDPDISSSTGGTVKITPSVRRVRYAGGPMMLIARAATGIINEEGFLCTANADGTAGPLGMVFPATDDTDLDPSGWSYEVEIKLVDGTTVPAFHVALPAGSTVDLAVIAPIPASGGTTRVVDTTSAERAEAAAAAAEATAASMLGWEPVIEWQGTSLSVGGSAPVDLQGVQGASIVDARDNGDQTMTFLLSDGSETAPVAVPQGVPGRGIASVSDPDEDSVVTITFTDGTSTTVQAIRGADSTVPGPTGPPGAVPTASDYLVVGPGRPDAPTTTGLSSAQIAALPVGCEYRSTDGAGTGAWVWRKSATGWIVSDGDTGWRTISDGTSAGVLGKGYTLRFRRVASTVEMRMNVNGNDVAMPSYSIVQGFRPAADDLQRAMYRGGTQNATGHFRIWWATLTYNGPQPAVNATALETWTTNNAWPTTLPGTAS